MGAIGEVIGVFKAFNIIDLVNVIGPPGTGELLALLCYFGVFIMFSVGTGYLWLLRGMWLTIGTAWIRGKLIGIIFNENQWLKFVLLDRDAKSYKKEDKDGTKTWLIRPEGISSLPNFARYTFFHYEVEHNLGLHELVLSYIGKNQSAIMSAKSLAQSIESLSNADKSALDDLMAGLIKVAPVIAILFAVGVVGVMLMSFVPAHSNTETTHIVEVIANATATTLTTLAPKVSGITT